MDSQATPFPILQEILSELAGLRAEVQALAGRGGKRRLSPEYISIADAAVMSGRTIKGYQRLLQRDAEKPGGCHPRRIHGAVHAADFRKMLDAMRIKGRGETIQKALEEIQL